MAAHGIAPIIHASDANGVPYVGAKAYIYEVGTATLRPIYSDAGLTTPRANPVISDARGNFARFYQASGTYKLRIDDADDQNLDEWDNIDTGIASGNPLGVAQGGTGATTAADARTNLDVPSNSEIADLASDITDLSNAIQNIAAFPQGYLTPVSGTPVLTSTDQIAKTSLFYTPFVGAQIPIWNGTQFVIRTFTELELELNSNHTANAIHDCFIIDDAGTLRLVTGPAWNTATVGSGSRGSGAGTTALARVGGLFVNAEAATMRYGATTLSVAANLGMYVGTILIDGSAGQITCHRTAGQSRKWSVWNTFNRRRITLIATDPDSDWNYSTGTFRASNNDTANSLLLVRGITEEEVAIQFEQLVGGASGSVNGWTLSGQIGIGMNGSTTPSGRIGGHYQTHTSGTAFTADQRISVSARHTVPPGIGADRATALEYALVTNVSGAFYGTDTNMQLIASWMG